MIRRTALIYIILLGFISCKIESDTPKVKPTPFDHKGYSQEVAATNPKIESSENLKPQKDSITALPKKEISADTIHLKFTYGKVKIDTVKTAEKALVFILDSDTAKKMQIEISSQDTLNKLTILQIINSIDQVEGPFDSKAVYEIKEKGEHKIIISENPEIQSRNGRFTFSAQLKW